LKLPRYPRRFNEGVPAGAVLATHAAGRVRRSLGTGHPFACRTTTEVAALVNALMVKALSCVELGLLRGAVGVDA
jgi:hypothetical protein